MSRAYADLSRDAYTYYWLAVNMRTFYHVVSHSKRKPVAADCMALCPFADYFNHAGHGVTKPMSKRALLSGDDSVR